MKQIINKLRNRIDACPKGLFVLFYTEMWELFGRFGITSLLVLYLTKTLQMSDAKAFAIFSAFLALIYVTPIIGGALCDRVLGNRHAIILGALIMVLGNLLLIIPNIMMVYLGLAIIIVGSGFFLPSIAPLVGFLYEGDERGRDAGFTIYYLGKNIGALIAPILCGIVAVNFGYHYAFILSAAGMISGIVVFVKGQKYLSEHVKKPTIKKIKLRGFSIASLPLIYIGAILTVPLVLLVMEYNVDAYLLIFTGLIVFVSLMVIAFKRTRAERRHIFAILALMIFVIIFEGFLNQGGTTLNLFIERIVNRHFFGFQLPTTFFFALDPIFMLSVGPFLAGLWLFLSKRKLELSVPAKFTIALFLLSLGFLVFVFAAFHAIMRSQASPLYIVLAYFIFPIAELCIVPISLSMVTRLAPKNLNAMMVGVWMLSSAAASFLTGQVSKIGQVRFELTDVTALSHAAYIYRHAFLVSAMTLAIAAIVLFIARPFIKRLML